MNSKTRISILACLTVAAIHPAVAQLAQWNFNSNPGDANTATGVLTPSIGSGTVSLIGGTTATFASGDASGGSSDPNVGDDSARNVTAFPTQGTANETAGIQFAVSTVGFQNIVVSWDQRNSNTSSDWGALQYSTDGSSFTTFGSPFQHPTPGDTWILGRSIDLSSVPAVNNNANFAFRIVSAFAPSTSVYEGTTTAGTYAAGGTWRFDMVTVSATPVPEPEEYAAMAGAALIGFAMWRRRSAK